MGKDTGTLAICGKIEKNAGKQGGMQREQRSAETNFLSARASSFIGVPRIALE